MLSLPEARGDPVLLIAFILGFLDLQSRFRWGMFPPEDVAKVLLKTQILPWHVELVPRNTARANILAGEATLTVKGELTE